MAAYPGKQNPEPAMRAWNSLKLGEDPKTRALVMKRLEEWKASKSWARENGRFIPHAKNWLFGRQWEMDPAEEDRKRASAAGQDDLLPAQRYTQRDYSREEEDAEIEAFYTALFEKPLIHSRNK